MPRSHVDYSRFYYDMQGGMRAMSKIQTGLRLPEEQYQRLQAMAQQMGVSLNALILLLIDAGLTALGKQA